MNHPPLFFLATSTLPGLGLRAGEVRVIDITPGPSKPGDRRRRVPYADISRAWDAGKLVWLTSTEVLEGMGVPRIPYDQFGAYRRNALRAVFDAPERKAA